MGRIEPNQRAASIAGSCLPARLAATTPSAIALRFPHDFTHPSTTAATAPALYFGSHARHNGKRACRHSFNRHRLPRPRSTLTACSQRRAAAAPYHDIRHFLASCVALAASNDGTPRSLNFPARLSNSRPASGSHCRKRQLRIITASHTPSHPELLHIDHTSTTTYHGVVATGGHASLCVAHSACHRHLLHHTRIGTDCPRYVEATVMRLQMPDPHFCQQCLCAANSSPD